MSKKPQKKKSGLRETVRKRIRRIRAARHLTQEALCDRAGISIDAVSRIEGGSRAPTLDTLEKLAAALGVSPGALVENKDLPSPTLAPPVQRVVNMLEHQPLAIQAAAERIVKVVIDTLASKKLELTKRAAETAEVYKNNGLKK